MDLASPWCDAGGETRRLFFLASLRFRQNVQTRRASDGVTFTAERPNISLVMCDEESFCRVEWDRLSMHGKQRIWLVVRNTLLSCQFKSTSRKERCSHEIYGHFALTLKFVIVLNSKPSAISRTPFLVKKFSNFCVKYWKIARLVGEEIR